MLDLHDIQTLLDRVTYKPNVKLQAVINDWSSSLPPECQSRDADVSVRVVMYTLDSRQEYPEPNRWIGLAVNGIKLSPDIVFPKDDDNRMYIDLSPKKVAQVQIVPWPIREYGDEKEFFRWLEHLLDNLEHHERREWFRVDGKIVNDPHKSSDWSK